MFHYSTMSTPTTSAPGSPKSYSENSDRFHRTVQSDILTAAIKVLTDDIMTTRKNSSYVHMSQLYNNTIDLSVWLNNFNKDVRETIYDEWYKTRKPDPRRVRNSIVIRNLTDDVSMADIYIICSRIGTVLDIYKPRDNKGFTFVDFEDSISIAVAIRELHKTLLNGETVTVELSKTAFTCRNDLTKEVSKMSVLCPFN
jgi:RNA recognition motif-containing protein